MHKSTKRVFIFLFLLGIIASVFSSDMILLSLFLFLHIVVLAIYVYYLNSELYIFSQSRSYVNSKSAKMFFIFTSSFLNAGFSLLISMIFLSYMINFITPILTQSLLNILESVFCGISIWVSGVSFIFVSGYLYKLFSHRKYDLPEDF